MSTEFWLAIGAISGVLIGWGIMRLDARRERRQQEADRQMRLKRDLRSSIADLAPPLSRRNGGQAYDRGTKGVG
jgi:uncharacterized membrane-anchored protein YhcB (DUF1043 family)